MKKGVLVLQKGILMNDDAENNVGDPVRTERVKMEMEIEERKKIGSSSAWWFKWKARGQGADR